MVGRTNAFASLVLRQWKKTPRVRLGSTVLPIVTKLLTSLQLYSLSLPALFPSSSQIPNPHNLAKVPYFRSLKRHLIRFPPHPIPQTHTLYFVQTGGVAAAMTRTTQTNMSMRSNKRGPKREKRGDPHETAIKHRGPPFCALDMLCFALLPLFQEIKERGDTPVRGQVGRQAANLTPAK